MEIAKAIIMAGCAVGAGLSLIAGIYGFVMGLLLMLLAPNLFLSNL